jgi:hypothetical protein
MLKNNLLGWAAVRSECTLGENFVEYFKIYFSSDFSKIYQDLKIAKTASNLQPETAVESPTAIYHGGCYLSFQVAAGIASF